jgi:hypothetical protein
MPEFGKLEARDRSVPRGYASRAASLAVGEKKYLMTLVDLSRTGARLCGPEHPVHGEDVLFRADGLKGFAHVVRSEGDVCAIEFATPLAPVEVQRLRGNPH